MFLLSSCRQSHICYVLVLPLCACIRLSGVFFFYTPVVDGIFISHMWVYAWYVTIIVLLYQLMMMMMMVMMVTCFTAGEANVVRGWQWERSSIGSSRGLSALSGQKVRQLLSSIRLSPPFTPFATCIDDWRDCWCFALTSSPIVMSFSALDIFSRVGAVWHYLVIGTSYVGLSKEINLLFGLLLFFHKWMILSHCAVMIICNCMWDVECITISLKCFKLRNMKIAIFMRYKKGIPWNDIILKLIFFSEQTVWLITDVYTAVNVNEVFVLRLVVDVGLFPVISYLIIAVVLFSSATLGKSLL